MVAPVQLPQVEDRGSFEPISFALLLIRALDKRWSGTLVITPPDAEADIVQFDRGLVSRVLVSDDHARLGTILVDAGVVMESEIDDALAKTDMLLGQALTSANVIDDKTLQRALVVQLIKRLERVFGYPLATSWTFGRDTSAFEGMPEGVRVDTLRVLWSGLTGHGEMGNWQAATLKRIGDTPFQVRRDVNLRRFGFTGDVINVVRAVRDERITIAELVGRGFAPEEVVGQIVYLLAITRYLDFSPAGASNSAPPTRHDSLDEMPSISEEATVDETPTSSDPPISSGRPEAIPPRRVARIRLRRVAVKASPAAPDPPGSGEPGSSSGRDAGGDGRDALLSEIQSRLARLESESPFALLDLQPGALRDLDDEQLIETVWKAYEEASRRWIPEACPNELSELREGMAKIHDAMGQALATLLDDDTREEALRQHLEGERQSPLSRTLSSEDFRAAEPEPPTSSTERAISRAPEALASPPDEPPPSGERKTDEASLPADALYARALLALSERRTDEALRLCHAACEAAPNQPDPLALAVWIRAHMDRPDVKVLLVELDDLLQVFPEHVGARYYRGVLRRRLGNDAGARTDFERVLELDPDHAGAHNQLSDAAASQSR